jgi:thiol-disulfide isomerase/thioredoxin
MHPIRLAAALAGLSLLIAPPAGAQGLNDTQGLAGALGLAAPPPPPLPAGTPAPAFATTSVAGKPLSLRGLRGKVVLLDYWATWCGPCRMATPTLQALHRQFGAKGLAVVGLSVDDPSTVPQVRPFLKRMGVTYTVAASPRANARAAQAYRVDGIPSQYLIDKKGVVRWSQGGYSPAERQELAVLIRKLLAE